MRPHLLQEALDALLEKASPSCLQKQLEHLSQIYRKGGNSESVFQTDLGCLAYLAARMPATFAASTSVLKEMKLRLPGWEGKTLLDLGAGPGAASWAALDHFPSIVKPVLLDQSRGAIQWGKKLAENHPVLAKAEWIHRSLLEKTPFPKADLAIICYALTELSHPLFLIEKIWASELPLFIAIEPGTPHGFLRLKAVRQHWLQFGGHIVAPCPHTLNCPMGKGDWCHFSTRLARTKLHRFLKMGDLGYEDEKFSYLILSRFPTKLASQRILRHPIKNKGHVQMILCAQSGQIETKTISRKDGLLYRSAREAKWGE